LTLARAWGHPAERERWLGPLFGAFRRGARLAGGGERAEVGGREPRSSCEVLDVAGSVLAGGRERAAGGAGRGATIKALGKDSALDGLRIPTQTAASMTSRRPTRATAALVVLGIAMVATTGGVIVAAHRYLEAVGSKLESARRGLGDVVILSYTDPFPNVDDVRRVAGNNPNVQRAGPFAMWPVELESSSVRRRGLLKLQSFDGRLAAQLGFSATNVPPAKRPHRDPVVALGTHVARELRVSTNDAITVRVQKDAGTSRDATVHCFVGAVMDWGLDSDNNQLAYADLSHLDDFALNIVGVELLLSTPAKRQDVASALQAQLGPPFKVFTLEELLAGALGPPPSTSGTSP